MKKTADICDELKGVEPCSVAMRCWGKRRAFYGHIRTVQCHKDYGMIRDVLSTEGKGMVLVVDGGGILDRAIFGDMMAARAIKNGWSGVIVHGAIRDTADIDAMDIGVFAPGTAPMRGESRGIGKMDIPVTFGNAVFTPGRLLVADADGVIVCPSGDLKILG